MKRIIMLLLAFLLLYGSMQATVNTTYLRTEQLVNPLGIDARQPRFSWRLESDQQSVMQTAYQVLVASSPEKLAQNIGDLWDSGKVSTDASQWIMYQGATLKTNMRAFWKVKVYTNKGEAAWSEPATFGMGILTETHWKGQWIGYDHLAPGDNNTQWSRLSARYLRTEFASPAQVKRATLHISGMGMYEVFINGRRVGEQVLAPAPTDYRKTVYYNTFDVTNLVEQHNAIGVTLGNGRYYTMRQSFKTYKIINFGYPKLRLNLIIEFADGSSTTIATDTKWKLSTDSPIRSNNEYDGEDYDARKEFEGWTKVGFADTSWMEPERVGFPDGTLRAQMTPNMKVMDKVTPISIKKVGKHYIMDMGQNMAGWVRFRVKGSAGDTIRLRFAEDLLPDGNLYMRNLRDALCTDNYIVSGKEPKDATWAPTFVYHGFRYVEISGYQDPRLQDFTGEVVEDEMAHVGSIETSNATLNTVLKNAFWGIRSNYKGMPVDCPQRNERQPWLGDHTTGSLSESFLFDNGTLYAKWMNDICEAQREDGCIPDVAPAFWNYYSDNMTWPSTLPIVCDMLYTQYGNIQPMQKSYNAIKRWLQHMKDEYMDTNGIMTKDKYGDWCVPPESLELIHSQDPARRTDGKLLATAYYYKCADLMLKFARLQGFDADVRYYTQETERTKQDFNRAFLIVKKGTSDVPGHLLYPDSIFYGNNTVTANILPLAFGMIPTDLQSEVEKNVIKTIITTNNGHISTGVIGTQWLMRELTAMGRGDIAYLLATNTTYPSWGYMAQKGATTFWELWNGDTADKEMNSANHVMILGDLLAWCYQNLAGIKSDTEKVGFKHLVMKPDFSIQDLSRISASYTSMYGKVVSNWTKTPMHLEWDIEIPANTTAEVHLPNGKVELIGSGKYHYSVDIPLRNAAIVKDEFLYETTSFPECHASSIVELKNGDLVATYFGGTKERNPDCCIWISRKPKGAKEWTAPQKAADGVFSLNDPDAAMAGVDASIPDHRKACWNPVLFQVPGGDLLLFYKIGLNVPDWSGWLVRSKDGGKTWSKREPLPKGFIGPVKNKPEYINGRIISPSSTEGENGWRMHFEISDDMGKTWRMVGPIETELRLSPAIQPVEMKEENLRPLQVIQPSILRHKDGRLQVLARTRNCHLATSWSSDNGETWSKVTLTDLPNNNSGTDAVTMQDGRHVLIYNDFGIPGVPKGPRTPINIAVSKDGIVWKNVITLEDSPISQYSYPAIIQGKDGKLHATYTWRRQRIKYAEIDPKKF